MNDLEQEFGKALTPKQIADFLGVDPRTVLAHAEAWGGVRVGKETWRFGQPFKNRQHFMRRLCERSGVKPFGFHAIRHFTASYLFRQGQPVGVVQKVLRHKSPNVTERYLRSLGFETNVIREALEEIGRKATIIPFKKEVGK